SIDFQDFEPEPLAPVAENLVLAECAEFTIRKFQLANGQRFQLEANEQPRLVHVVSGAVELSGEEGTEGKTWMARRGDNVLLPYAAVWRIVATEGSVVLVTDGFVCFWGLGLGGRDL